jgi:Co/Zn/Cd efflux system component
VSLFADRIDFLEDASVNFLILNALGATARERARVGMALAGILLVPGLPMLWTAWEKFSLPAAPDPVLLSLTGAGALAVNMSCALMLTHYRRHSGSLTKAAFFSARNDAVANIAIIAVGLVTAYETVSNLGGLPAIGPGGRPGGAQGKRDDQGRDDLPALFSPQV